MEYKKRNLKLLPIKLSIALFGGIALSIYIKYTRKGSLDLSDLCVPLLVGSFCLLILAVVVWFINRSVN